MDVAFEQRALGEQLRDARHVPVVQGRRRFHWPPGLDREIFSGRFQAFPDGRFVLRPEGPAAGRERTDLISYTTGWWTSPSNARGHEALRAAYQDDAVVITPDPRVHTIFADERNLSLLSDQTTLRAWGFSAEMLADLTGVPRTVLVSSDNAQQLWEARKKLFFKPAGGHGSKAVYRGDKVTKGVWADVIRGGMSPRTMRRRVSAWSRWTALRMSARLTSGSMSMTVRFAAAGVYWVHLTTLTASKSRAFCWMAVGLVCRTNS